MTVNNLIPDTNPITKELTNDSQCKDFKFPFLRVLVYSLFGLLLGTAIEVTAKHFDPYIEDYLYKSNHIPLPHSSVNNKTKEGVYAINTTNTTCNKGPETHRALIQICIGVILVIVCLFFVLTLVDPNIPTTIEGLFFSTMFFVPLVSLSDNTHTIAKHCIKHVKNKTK